MLWVVFQRLSNPGEWPRSWRCPGIYPVGQWGGHFLIGCLGYMVKVEAAGLVATEMHARWPTAPTGLKWMCKLWEKCLIQDPGTGRIPSGEDPNC